MNGISIYRIAVVQIVIILSFIILYFGRVFLIPLAFAILFSMMLAPLSRQVEKWGMSRIPATLLCLLIILLFIGTLFSILAAQTAGFSEELPQIQQRLQQMLDRGQQWIEQQFGVAPQEQILFVKAQISRFSQSFNQFATGLVSGGVGLVSGFILILVYFFFIMWKREKYEAFLLKLTDKDKQPEVRQELNDLTQVASRYLLARLISMIFLAFVYATGFSLIGLQHAVLISLVAVLPTIVPYIGAFIGGFFPLIMALVSGSAGMLIPVLAVLVLAQMVDNNIIEPLVEGNSLNLSPLITIIAIVLGELTWGIAGMILFIPLFAILRIICDYHPALSPYGFLLANDVAEPVWVEKMKGWFSKKLF